MIHKAFPGGIEDLREYVMELAGAKDHWVRNMDDPTDTRWEYTYHQRLADWGTWKEKGPQTAGKPGSGIDQIAKVVDKLARQPFTRQAQMITWMPFMDLDAYDPPCLQSVWYRLLEDGDALSLNCNVRFRSNDAWGASFMNMFGFIHFNRHLIADPLQERTGRRVGLGRLNWQADSYHLYGKDQGDFRARFQERLSTSRFEDRVFSFFSEGIQEIWREAGDAAKRKIASYDGGRDGR
jgi:thymidylate synthase